MELISDQMLSAGEVTLCMESVAIHGCGNRDVLVLWAMNVCIRVVKWYFMLSISLQSMVHLNRVSVGVAA